MPSINQLTHSLKHVWEKWNKEGLECRQCLVWCTDRGIGLFLLEECSVRHAGEVFSLSCCQNVRYVVTGEVCGPICWWNVTFNRSEHVSYHNISSFLPVTQYAGEITLIFICTVIPRYKSFRFSSFRFTSRDFLWPHFVINCLSSI
jgi:hypothetical protein